MLSNGGPRASWFPSFSFHCQDLWVGMWNTHTHTIHAHKSGAVHMIFGFLLSVVYRPKQTHELTRSLEFLSKWQGNETNETKKIKSVKWQLKANATIKMAYIFSMRVYFTSFRFYSIYFTTYGMRSPKRGGAIEMSYHTHKIKHKQETVQDKNKN